MKLNGTHQLLAYADDVNILGGSIRTVKENAEALVAAAREIGLAVNIVCVAESTRNSCCRGCVRAQADGRCLSELDMWVARLQTQTISYGVFGEQSSFVIRDSETGLSSVALKQACHLWL